MTDNSTGLRFQIVASIIRRDGVHHSIRGVVDTVQAAMGQLMALEASAPPFWFFNVRGVKPDQEKSLQGFKPRFSNHTACKLYAVEVVPADKTGGAGPFWTSVWGRTIKEAKSYFRLTDKSHRILQMVELTLEQEKEVMAARNNPELSCRLLALYGSNSVKE